jgi:hypothetical protein
MHLGSLRRRNLDVQLCVFASVMVCGLGLEARSIDPGRIVNRAGIVVFREKSFYSDDLVKCVRFAHIEDRTAFDNPALGYFVFTTSSGQLQLPPQTLEGRFFFDELEFPSTLKPSSDLERLVQLQGRLRNVYELNASVSSVLQPYYARVSEAVMRLRKGDWWENGARWVTIEERDQRTAFEEKGAIDAAAIDARARIKSANHLGALTSATDALALIESLPATSAEVAYHKKDASERLVAELDGKRLALEQAFVSGAYAELKSSLEEVSTLNEMTAVAAKIDAFGREPVTTAEATQAKEQHAEELRVLSASRERTLRLSGSLFDNMSDWRKALDDSSRSLPLADSVQAAIVERSEQLYKQAVAIKIKLEQCDSALRGFFAGLPAKLILTGEGLPPAPSGIDDALKEYDAFVVVPGGFSSISVSELEGNAEGLKARLSLYRQLAAMSQRATRQELWRNLQSFEELLEQMGFVQQALRDEKVKYDALIGKARDHEQSKHFADAAKTYQSALDIAPSPEIAAKIESMKDQDLGL